MNRWLFWDFADTLAYRKGRFSGALYNILKKHFPDTIVTADELSNYLKTGFPWQNPEKSYLHLTKPELWWENIERIFENAFVLVGYSDKAKVMSKEAHYEYLNPCAFCLYEDTLEALTYFKAQGWQNAILSNHVPELPEIALSLGLGDLIEHCFTSARIGFEKPNPEIFYYALRKIGDNQNVWMIGDNPNADVYGGENVGIKSILVRTPKIQNIKYHASNLLEIKKIVS